MQREGRVDLEAVETAMRAAVLAAGAKVMEELLRGVGTGRRDERVRCACGEVMYSKGLRAINVLTLLGPVRFVRSMYLCPRCGKTRYPGDEELDIVNTSRSPGVHRQVLRLGAKEPFAEVSDDLRELAGLHLCRKEAERIAEKEGKRTQAWLAQQWLRFGRLQPPVDILKTIRNMYIELDGTGIPVIAREAEGRKGKQQDGRAKTREAKIAAMFLQTLLDEEGRPIRDPHSTSYIGAIESAQQFGLHLYAEAVRRGLFQAQRVIVLGDGAEWIKNLVRTHFPMAQFIIDYYHASEHVGQLCRALFDQDTKRIGQYRDRWTEELWEGNIEVIVEQATALLPKDPSAKLEAQTQIAYFSKNKDYMRYGQFRKEGLFIGSGVVEAACKHVVGQRFKQSGMEWSVEGANAILAARCLVLSNRLEEYCEQKNAA